jgi:hypothetical protein
MLIGTNTLSAQSWGNLSPLFQFFPEGTQAFFDEEFDVLSNALQHDNNDGLQLSDFDLDLVGDSLFYYLNYGTIGEADANMLFWQYHQDQLDLAINDNNVSPEDSLTLASEFIRVEDIWHIQNDNLNAVIDNYPTTLMEVSSLGIDRANDRWDNYQGTWVQSFSYLENNGYISSTPVPDVVTLEDLLDETLFSSIYDFEIAYGQEFSDINFYKESYSARSSLLRVASVPKLNQLFEARWAIEASFFNAPEDLTENPPLLSDAEVSNNDIVNLGEGLNPFIVNANFAITYSPVLGTVSSSRTFRLYSSIGMELSSYIPSHRTESVSFRVDHTNRVGKTTGYGPQIGAGFIVNYANYSFYSYGTVAAGIVNLSTDYRYDSRTINAGIRFGDTINVRYTLGESSWAPNLAKSARFSRFTVGIILDELRRP